MEKRVLDLNAGLGGRIYAFEKAGFEISAVIDKDFENCAIISSWVNTDKIINRNFDTYNSLTPNWYYKVLR